jgi:hypothetical protein
MKPLSLSLLWMVLLLASAAPQAPAADSYYEDTIYPFNAVFDLLVADTLRAQWSEAQFDTFMNAVFDADTTPHPERVHAKDTSVGRRDCCPL